MAVAVTDVESMSSAAMVIGAMPSLYWTVCSAGLAVPTGGSLTAFTAMVTVAWFESNCPSLAKWAKPSVPYQSASGV